MQVITALLALPIIILAALYFTTTELLRTPDNCFTSLTISVVQILVAITSMVMEILKTWSPIASMILVEIGTVHDALANPSSIEFEDGNVSNLVAVAVPFRQQERAHIVHILLIHPVEATLHVEYQVLDLPTPEFVTEMDRLES